MTLLGRFLGVEGRTARFAPDLDQSVAWGDERHDRFMGLVRKLVDERGLPEPDVAPLEPFDPTSPESLDLAGFGAVLCTGGFRPDFSWVHVPGGFDEMGFPVQVDGASAAAPGLYFVGVHWQRKRKSSIFYGVGEDARAGGGTRSPGRARNATTLRPQCAAKCTAGSFATQLVSGAEAGSSIHALRMSMKHSDVAIPL